MRSRRGVSGSETSQLSSRNISGGRWRRQRSSICTSTAFGGAIPITFWKEYSSPPRAPCAAQWRGTRASRVCPAPRECCKDMTSVAIIDYGVGNLRSVEKAFLATDCDAVLSSDRQVLLKAERLVLTGVGAYATC